MYLFLLIFLLMKFDIKCEDVCKSKTVSESTTNRLIEHLLCAYGRHKMDPSYLEKNMTFNLNLLPRYVEFEKEADTVELFTWLNVSWYDTDLMWEPTEWDGIRWINIHSNNIEMPTVELFFRGNIRENERKLPLKKCLLTYNGSIHCITPERYKTHCLVNYYAWPYDKYNCGFGLGGWEIQYNNTNFNFGDDTINMTAFRPNREWHVSVIKWSTFKGGSKSRPDNTRVFLAAYFHLERRGLGLAVMYILPIVVFMTLTLIVLWLDSESLERILVASINLSIHILGLCNLHKAFPTKGSVTTNTPHIILTYEASIGLAAYALIFTCLLRKLKSLKVSAPTWIVSGTTLVINSPVTPYLGIATNRKRETELLCESDSNECPNRRIWLEFATILEWISFVIVFVTYATMLGIVLRPKMPAEAFE